MATAERPIGPYVFTDYTDPAAADVAYDPRSPDVAGRIAGLIQSVLPAATVEHIGSTAIPGCDGKGVIDMMVLYPEGGIAEARAAVEQNGYQRFESRDPFPPERPVYIGTIEHNGDIFRTHAHLMPPDWPEIVTQRVFRDRLSANPELVAEYVAVKRAVLATGTKDSAEYNDGKNAFIKDVIEGRR